jgi:hypothetical protein
MLSFKCIAGNPPFTDVSRNNTQHKLWIDFTKLAFNKLLERDGYLAWVTPASFSSPSNKILSIFQSYKTLFLSFDTNAYFKAVDNDVGIKMAHYIIQRQLDTSSTNVQINNTNFDFTFNQSVVYLPNDICQMSLSIHNKVMWATTDKLRVEHDYVTCHNVQLARKSPADCPISKTKTQTHIYPILHTNNQIWYSSIEQLFLSKKKVLWSRSGESKPRYDNGTMGITDMGYYVLVNTDSEGINLAHILNLKLFKYIFKTAKWSGFGNEKVFSMLPNIPLHQQWSDNQLYEYFNITPEEQTYIQNLLSNTLPKVVTTIPDIPSTIDPYVQHVRYMDYMGNIQRNQHRITQTQEVFTPTTLVLELLHNIPEYVFIENHTVLDPSCGDGQFLAEVIVKKMQYGHSLYDALSTTYGVELMPDNVAICKERLAGPTPTPDIISMLQQNIVCHDGLTYDYTFGKSFFEYK